jgi:extracellular elastinolytic metalloproteinase
MIRLSCPTSRWIFGCGGECVRRAVVLLAFLLLITGTVTAAQVMIGETKGESDIRIVREDPATELRSPEDSQRVAADRLFEISPGAVLRWDGISGSPRWLAGAHGKPLSPTSDLRPEAAARVFLGEHRALFALRGDEIDELELTSAVPAPSGGTHLYFTQRIAGISVFGGRLNITVGASGRVLWLGSRLFGDLSLPGDPVITAGSALARAAGEVYPDRLITGRVLEGRETDHVDRLVHFDEAEFARPPRVRLVLFPERVGARLAWEVRLTEPSRQTDYRVLIDSESGRVLVRTNLNAYLIQGNVLLGDHPDPEYEEWNPQQYQLTSFPEAIPESPQGWITGGSTLLEGNNAMAFVGNEAQPLGQSSAGYFSYPFNTNESRAVNVWYWVNEAHDRFYAAGFNEAAGNFQQDNFGNGGLGSDPIRIVTLLLHADPFFNPTEDGEPPTLSLGWMPKYPTVGLSSDCWYCADHDGLPESGGERAVSYDRDTIVHEYTHGVSSRRVGGPADATCLQGRQPEGMAEAWSDLFAASFFDDPSLGDFRTQGMGFQYDLRHDVGLEDSFNVYTYFYFTWGGALWDLRQSFIALDPGTGLEEFHEVIVESLAIVPCSPTLLEGRDAVLAADTVLFGSAHHQAIWNVFASRGLGEAATTVDENDLYPVPDQTVPVGFECVPPVPPSGLTAVVESDNEVRLDYQASGALSVEVWRDDLDNPADAPELIAFTDDTTTFIDDSVQEGKRYSYHLVALGGGGVVCHSATSTTAVITATGTCSLEYPLFVPGLRHTAGVQTCAASLTWDAATEACPGSGEPIVYNIYRAVTPGFLPADLHLVGRTMGTSFNEVLPDIVDSGVPTVYWYNNSWNYLVLAQHGTLDDPPDHSDRGSSQVLQWLGVVPTTGVRTTIHSWNFDSGPQGWTEWGDAGYDDQRWVVVDPLPTYYGGALWAPDEAAGGSGMAWVMGDPGMPADSVFSSGCGYNQALQSPALDPGVGGNILSFDYWVSQQGRPGSRGELYAGLRVKVNSVWISAIGLQTIQRFNGPGRYGWQHYEIDIGALGIDGVSELIFNGAWCEPEVEYGIDNVRIEKAAPCSGAGLVLQNVSIDDSSPGWGNGNGFLEPGEIARVGVTLLNDGRATAVAPEGAITSLQPGVTILDGQVVFPDIPPDSTQISNDGFIIALTDDLACDGTVVFELNLNDITGASTTEYWTIEVGEAVTDLLLQDTFETDQGWSVWGAGPFQGAWQRGKPNVSSEPPDADSPRDAGDFCYATGLRGSGGGSDDVDPGADPVLASPSINVDGYKRIRYSADIFFHNAGAIYPDQLLNDAAFEVSWLDDSDGAIINAFLNTFDDSPAWNEYNDQQELSSWFPKFTINPLVPMDTDIRLAFKVSDGELDHIVEAGVDNVIIEGDRQVCNAISINPPNPVGNTLVVGRTGANTELLWSVPSTDPLHDAAVYYRVHVSNTPGAEYTMEHAPMIAALSRPPGGSGNEYYLVSAVNGGGASGEDP